MSKTSVIIGSAIALAAVVALTPPMARAQSISLPDGGSVSIDIGDDGGSVSVTAPSIGVDFSISFGGGGGGGDPGSVSGIGGQSAGAGGVAALGKSRAISIPGLSGAATAGPSGGSEQASRSLANAAPGKGPTARGLEGECPSSYKMEQIAA